MPPKIAEGTYPQPRQMLEQVKYSSGKKEFLLMCSSGTSPLKRSLRAWSEERRFLRVGAKRRTFTKQEAALPAELYI